MLCCVSFFKKALSSSKRKWFFIFCSILFCFLACASNPLSFVFLLSLLPFFIFFQLLFPSFANSFEQEGLALTKRNGLVYFGIVGLGFALEEIIKSLYEQYCRDQFGTTHSVPLEKIFLHDFFSRFFQEFMVFFSPLYMLALIVTIALMTWLFYKRSSNVLIASACLFLAFLNFAACIASRYVSGGNYHPRYFTPTYFFLCAALTLSLTLFIVTLKESQEKLFSTVFFVCGAVVSMIMIARIQPEPIQIAKKQEIESLTTQYPRAIVLGNYWEVYRYRALETNAHTASIPVPAEGDYNRTMWDLRRLKIGAVVFVPTSNALSQQAQFKNYGFQFVKKENTGLGTLPFAQFEIVSGEPNFFKGICSPQIP
jgi:hypothetical protein